LLRRRLALTHAHEPRAHLHRLLKSHRAERSEGIGKDGEAAATPQAFRFVDHSHAQRSEHGADQRT